MFIMSLIPTALESGYCNFHYEDEEQQCRSFNSKAFGHYVTLPEYWQYAVLPNQQRARCYCKEKGKVCL